MTFNRMGAKRPFWPHLHNYVQSRYKYNIAVISQVQGTAEDTIIMQYCGAYVVFNWLLPHVLVAKQLSLETDQYRAFPMQDMITNYM